MKRFSRLRQLLVGFLWISFGGLVLGSSGCSNSLVVKAEIPPPMVDSLPLVMGVHYDESLRNYTYVEENKDREEWTIDNGAAQVNMFATILPEMFDKVVQVPDINNVGKDQPDLIFSPLIEQFQYSLPRETRINVYEIWIKYNMRVYDTQGELVADWIMTAYGKTPTAFIKSKEKALNEAMVVALRDAGASFSIGFKRVPEIRAWLENH